MDADRPSKQVRFAERLSAGSPPPMTTAGQSTTSAKRKQSFNITLNTSSRPRHAFDIFKDLMLTTKDRVQPPPHQSPAQTDMSTPASASASNLPSVPPSTAAMSAVSPFVLAHKPLHAADIFRDLHLPLPTGSNQHIRRQHVASASTASSEVPLPVAPSSSSSKPMLPTSRQIKKLPARHRQVSQPQTLHAADIFCNLQEPSPTASTSTPSTSSILPLPVPHSKPPTSTSRPTIKLPARRRKVLHKPTLQTRDPSPPLSSPPTFGPFVFNTNDILSTRQEIGSWHGSSKSMEWLLSREELHAEQVDLDRGLPAEMQHPFYPSFVRLYHLLLSICSQLTRPFHPAIFNLCMAT
jgi:hypothetical protein